MEQPAKPQTEDDLSLAGMCIACFESRMTNEVRRLFERRGATVLSAPALQEIPLDDQHSAFEFGDRLAKGEVDVLLLLTGVGTKMLVDALSSRWEREWVISQIGRLQLLCRGPKPVGALKALGLTPSFVVPEPNTWRDIVSAFDAQEFGKNRRVWIQEYGRPNPELVAALAARSEFVGTVALYGWKLPDDLEPVKAALGAMVAGTVNVAAFTAGVQIDHLFEIADRLSLRPALLQTLNERTVIASIGPMTTERLVAHGLSVDIEPQHPKLGHMVRSVAERARDVFRQKRR